VFLVVDLLAEAVLFLVDLLLLLLGQRPAISSPIIVDLLINIRLTLIRPRCLSEVSCPLRNPLMIAGLLIAGLEALPPSIIPFHWPTT
jgi:hypothetical protein